MKRLFSIAFFLFSIVLNLPAQNAMKGFSHLSKPEKHWVIAHPFIAKKTYRCANRTRFVTDSLSKNNILKDGNGGQLDAFRHAYWMALLVQEFSPAKAQKIGEVHEKGNYKDFLKGHLEDSIRADSMMCVMDLKNNSSGIQIGLQFKNDTSVSKISLEQTIINAVKTGKLVMLKKDSFGHWIDANGRMIVLSNYHNKWYIPKCIVRSDYIMEHPTENQH